MKKPLVITISGKGGVGKTTLTALLVDEIIRQSYIDPILVIDADPAVNLHLLLGFPAPTLTLADIRDDNRLPGALRDTLGDSGPSAQNYLASQFEKTITRRAIRGCPIDHVALGHPEGQGCYCNINRLLGQVMETQIDRYGLVIVDNEAGLECLSRLRIRRADLFLVVANHSRASRLIAGDILVTARRCGMEIKQAEILLNRTNALVDDLSRKISLPQLPLPVIRIPEDTNMAWMEGCGLPVLALAGDSPARVAIRQVAEQIVSIPVAVA